MKQIAFALCVLAFSGFSNASHYRGLCVVDDDIAWMSGSQGTVLRTTDGGAHWDTLNPSGYSNRDFRDIHAWSHKKAVVMSAGDSAVLLMTNNGGKSWIMLAQDNSPGVFWDAIDILGSGLILAGDGTTPDIRYSHKLKTLQAFKATYYSKQNLLWELGMLTETKPASLYAASGTTIQWIDGLTFAYIPVYGDKSLFIKTEMVKGKKFIDYTIREKWSQTIIGFSILPFKSQKAGGAYSFAMHGSNAVAVGGSYLVPDAADSVACYSEDSGNTWLLSDNMPAGYRSCVCRKNNSDIWFCTGTNGTDISTDNGHNWQPINIPGFNVCATSGQYLWLAGNKGQWKRYHFSEVLP